MRQAVSMVQAYIRAGFHKIHLDAGVACADDCVSLSGEIIAARDGRLAPDPHALRLSAVCRFQGRQGCRLMLRDTINLNVILSDPAVIP